MPTAKVEVKLRPFLVPNFATIDLNPRLHGDKNEASLPIAELDHAALDALAEAWLTELYKKAGKRNPFQMRENERCAA